MRAAPAYQVTLRRFGAWQIAVRLLAGCTEAALLAWVLGRDPPNGFEIFAAGCAALVVWRCAASLTRTPAMTLRWDGQLWWLGQADTDPAGPVGPAPRPGHVQVALDLGSWMLLRFTPASAARARWSGARMPSLVTWLPAQRAGLETEWHGLRCTVFAPLPSRAPEPADARTRPEQAA
ncbi:MAG: hypothetical protein M3O01_00215 [Pseudomonadota bacterium]|nr:hypothetical protein [Pseudomonadota bacterium]